MWGGRPRLRGRSMSRLQRVWRPAAGLESCPTRFPPGNGSWVPPVAVGVRQRPVRSATAARDPWPFPSRSRRSVHPCALYSHNTAALGTLDRAILRGIVGPFADAQSGQLAGSHLERTPPARIADSLAA